MMVFEVVVLVMADPSPSCDRAKGEPDETGGSTEHVKTFVVVPVGVVPMVMWHISRRVEVEVEVEVGVGVEVEVTRVELT